MKSPLHVPMLGLALTMAATYGWTQANPQGSQSPNSTSPAAPRADEPRPETATPPEADNAVNPMAPTATTQSGITFTTPTLGSQNIILDPRSMNSDLKAGAQLYYSPSPGYVSPDSRLNTPIHVEMSQASLQQALQSLTSSSGVTIKPGKDVSFVGRLSIEARSVPLKTVMEGIAQQTHLMIERSGATYIFASWPSLTINGQKRSIDWPGSPWANSLTSQWTTQNLKIAIAPNQSANMPTEAMLPSFTVTAQSPNNYGSEPPRADPPQKLTDKTNSAPNRLQLQYTPSLTNPSVAYQYQVAPNTGVTKPGGHNNLPRDGGVRPEYLPTVPDAIGSGLSVTPMGDRLFVVTEPDKGLNNVPGYRLTVYKLDQSDKLRKVSSIFHPSAQPVNLDQSHPTYWNAWGDMYNPNVLPQLRWQRNDPNAYNYMNMYSDSAATILPYYSTNGVQNGNPGVQPPQAKTDKREEPQPPKTSLGPPNEDERPVAPPVRPEQPTNR